MQLGPKMIEFGRRPNWNCPKDEEDSQTSSNPQVTFLGGGIIANSDKPDISNTVSNCANNADSNNPDSFLMCQRCQLEQSRL